MRMLGSAVLLGVALQITLGFLSVATSLAVVPVSLHTLVAASILALTVALVAMTWPGWGGADPSSEPEHEALAGGVASGR